MNKAPPVKRRRRKRMISYPQRVAGLDTRVIEAGTTGQAVVLVHGTGGRADRWLRNVDALAAAGLHAYAFDLPGHGFASKGSGIDCSVPGYRRFLAAFLDEMKIDKPVIVGTSLGGHVVASYACENPDRVAGIVLSGSMGLVPLGAEARGRVEKGANNQTYQGVKDKLARVIFDPALVTQDFIDEEFRINNSAGAKESFATLGRYIGQQLDDDVVGERLAALTPKLPTLLVWGTEDKTVPLAVGEAAAKLLPGSKLVVLPNAAHTAYYERADDFNNILRDFVAGISKGRR
jgi:pimeloyl-ACP methyl ester carboxylesterase